MIVKLIGVGGLIGCLATVYLFEGTSFSDGAFRLFHWPAMTLTGIGPLALIFICSDWLVMARTFSLVLGSSPSRHQKRHDREAILLQRLSKEFSEEGPGIFENVKTGGTSDFLRKTLDRLAVRMPTTDVRELLEAERNRRQARLCQSINVVSLGVRLAPSVGMLGTILGMVQLLSTLQDPSHIGSHMSLALLTTFYGLFFSLVVWTPLQQKIERLLEVQLDGYNQVLQWLELIEKRKPSNYFEEAVDLPPVAVAQGSRSR